MGYVQKQRGKYRARFADPLGKVQSRTFTRTGDAERFLRELQADRVRGQWVDPRSAIASDLAAARRSALHDRGGWRLLSLLRLGSGTARVSSRTVDQGWR